VRAVLRSLSGTLVGRVSPLGLILVILLVLLLFGGGFGYRGVYGQWPYYGYGIGGLGIILVILLILVLFGRI
jgi:hypothetical protein